MVRLGERMLLLNPEMNYLVSIPVWFDWEYHDAFDLLGEDAFQFQYGSIGSSGIKQN